MKPKHDKATTMVGVSTKQNTTNLLAFLQFDLDRLLLLETDGARMQGWSEGLQTVLVNRGKKTRIIPAGPGDGFSEMVTALRQETDALDAVCWNIGGGQKMQQIALMSVFLQRLDDNKADWACYTEPQSKQTYRIIGRKGDLESTPKPTDVFLDLNEILAVFGRRAGGKHMQLLWAREGMDGGQPVSHGELLPSAASAAIYDDDKRQAMYAYTLRLHNGEVASEAHPFPEPFEDFSPYFEACVQQRVLETIAAKPQEHCVNQVWRNVRVFNRATSAELAEYDVLLVTNFGTFIPLDAKTYDFRKKDEDARLHNLAEASGLYTTFWSIFPYFARDIQNDSILQREQVWSRLLRQPFAIAERGGKMLVMAERGRKHVEIVQSQRKGKVALKPDGGSKPEKPGDRCLEVPTMENLVQALGLNRA